MRRSAFTSALRQRSKIALKQPTFLQQERPQQQQRVERLIVPRCVLAANAESSSEFDLLSVDDIVVGAALAFSLAFLFSFLQGRRSQTDVVLWDNQQDNTRSGNSTKVFGSDGWEEISQPENYILYKSQLRKRRQPSSSKRDKFWALAPLLVLFVPIFTFELFLALSRQFICWESGSGYASWVQGHSSDLLGHSSWARELCNAHYGP